MSARSTRSKAAQPSTEAVQASGGDNDHPEEGMQNMSAQQSPALDLKVGREMGGASDMTDEERKEALREAIEKEQASLLETYSKLSHGGSSGARNGSAGVNVHSHVGKVDPKATLSAITSAIVGCHDNPGLLKLLIDFGYGMEVIRIASAKDDFETNAMAVLSHFSAGVDAANGTVTASGVRAPSTKEQSTNHMIASSTPKETRHGSSASSNFQISGFRDTPSPILTRPEGDLFLPAGAPVGAAAGVPNRGFTPELSILIQPDPKGSEKIGIFAAAAAHITYADPREYEKTHGRSPRTPQTSSMSSKLDHEKATPREWVTWSTELYAVLNIAGLGACINPEVASATPIVPKWMHDVALSTMMMCVSGRSLLFVQRGMSQSNAHDMFWKLKNAVVSISAEDLAEMVLSIEKLQLKTGNGTLEEAFTKYFDELEDLILNVQQYDPTYCPDLATIRMRVCSFGDACIKQFSTLIPHLASMSHMRVTVLQIAKRDDRFERAASANFMGRGRGNGWAPRGERGDGFGKDYGKGKGKGKGKGQGKGKGKGKGKGRGRGGQRQLRNHSDIVGRIGVTFRPMSAKLTPALSRDTRATL